MKNNNFIIGPLTSTNIDDAIRLRDKIFSHLEQHEKETLKASLDKKNYTKCLKKNELVDINYYVMINTSTGAIIGLTGIYHEETDKVDMCWLGWFCIDKQYRGQGLSKTLLDYSIGIAKSLKKQYLHLYTYDSKEYIPAIKLYEQYNFTVYEKDKKDIYYKLEIGAK